MHESDPGIPGRSLVGGPERSPYATDLEYLEDEAERLELLVRARDLEDRLRELRYGKDKDDLVAVDLRALSGKERRAIESILAEAGLDLEHEASTREGARGEVPARGETSASGEEGDSKDDAACTAVKLAARLHAIRQELTAAGARVAGRRAATTAAGRTLAVDRLAASCELEPIDLDLLLTLALPLLLPRIRSLCCQCLGSWQKPEFGLLIGLRAAELQDAFRVRGRFAKGAPLIRHHLANPNGSAGDRSSEGVLVVTTNLPEDMDPAFARRFRYRPDYGPPGPEARAGIWRSHIPAQFPLAQDVDLGALAREFPLTGGEIRNALILAATDAARAGRDRVTMDDLRAAAAASSGLARGKGRLGFGAGWGA